MVIPQRIGRFLTADAAGNIQPDVQVELIGELWKPLVHFVSARLMESSAVDAMYVRGSVPRGLAIEGISDIDFVYVGEKNLDELEVAVEKEAKEKFPFVRGIELLRISPEKLEKIYTPQTRPYFQMLLKTQSLFLGGTDIAKNIAPFKAGVNMASHAFSIREEFRSRAADVENRQWLCRRIVRSGFEITMPQINRFTRDLYLCYEQFSGIYPQYADEMYRVLVNCLNANEDPTSYEQLIDFIDSETVKLIS